MSVVPACASFSLINMETRLAIFALLICAAGITAGCLPIPLLPDNNVESDIEDLLDNNASRVDVIIQLGNPVHEDESTISYFACGKPAGFGWIMCLGYQCGGSDFRSTECYELALEFDDSHRLSGYKKLPFAGSKQDSFIQAKYKVSKEFRLRLTELRAEAIQGKIESASVLAVAFGDPSFLEKQATENLDAQRALTFIKYGRSYSSSSLAGLTDTELSKRALGGDPEASYQLYWNKSDTQPLAWLCHAADLGQHEARYRLGVLYWQGSEGLEQDNVQSYKWYVLAAQTGNYDAWKELRRIKREVLTADDLAQANALVGSWKPGQCERDLKEAMPEGDE